jgi:hypothetical protein
MTELDGRIEAERSRKTIVGAGKRVSRGTDEGRLLVKRENKSTKKKRKMRTHEGSSHYAKPAHGPACFLKVNGNIELRRLDGRGVRVVGGVTELGHENDQSGGGEGGEDVHC